MTATAPKVRYGSAVDQITALMVNAADRNLWPHLVRALRRRLRPAGRQALQDDVETRSWCEERALDTGPALRHLGVSEPATALRERFPEIWEEARRRIEACPVPFARLGIAGGADVELLFHLCRRAGARQVLETGVALGWSSLAFLLALPDDPAARLHSVDLPYTRLRAGPWVGLVVPPHLRDRWTIYRMADREGLPQALAHAPFDLCHYDSDKSPEGRLWAYPQMWKALRPGGFLISDDIGDNHAWRTFCADIAHESLVVRTGARHAGVLVKPGAGSVFGTREGPIGSIS